MAGRPKSSKSRGPRVTPDGRYFIVEGKLGPRLWRASNPHLSEDERRLWVGRLMRARSAVRQAKGHPARIAEARAEVDEAKRALGERGPPWWTDGAPDWNRRLVKNTPYQAWLSSLADKNEEE